MTPEQVEERRSTRAAADLAEIVYTSGLTGRPKGCMLSHGNIVANARNCMCNDGFTQVFNEHNSTLLSWPLAHSYAQVIQYGAIDSAHRPRPGSPMGDAGPRTARLRRDERAVGAAAVGEGVQQRQAPGQRAGHAGIFARAEATAIAWSRALDDGGPGLLLRVRHALYDRLVYGKLRAALGGRVQYSWSAAAPLGARLGHFFRGCGITVLEGYGLTETSPATNSDTLDAQKIGTVGVADPGCTIRIAPDGRSSSGGTWHSRATGTTRAPPRR